VRSVRSGVGYARRTADLRIVLLLVGAAALSYSGLFAVGLPALARTYRGGSFLLGALFAAWGLGQLFGVLSAAVTGLPRRWGLLIIGVSTAEGMSFLIIGIRPDFAVALCLLALLGFCVAYSTDVALPTFVQATTPLTMLGRVNSLINLPRVVLAPASIAGMGLLAAADVRWPFFAAAIPMLLTGLGLAGNKHARAIGTDD
jgi:MFS family permease